MSPGQLATVAVTWNAVAAWIIRNRLASEGLRAFVADEHLVTANWFFAEAIGGIKVQVPAPLADRAAAVLAVGMASLFRGPPWPHAAGDGMRCPCCGSPDIEAAPLERRAIIVVWLIFGFPWPIYSDAVECYDCGARDGPPTAYALEENWTRAVLCGAALLAVLAAGLCGGQTTWLGRAADAPRSEVRVPP